MDRSTAASFAAAWVEAWNRRDVEAVLALFAEEVVFSSPTALEVVGTKTVRGKPALRSYWQEALKRAASLTFRLDRVIWDPEARELAMIYTSERNDQRRRVAEIYRFDDENLVTSAEVLHGVIPG